MLHYAYEGIIAMFAMRSIWRCRAIAYARFTRDIRLAADADTIIRRFCRRR